MVQLHSECLFSVPCLWSFWRSWPVPLVIIAAHVMPQEEFKKADIQRYLAKHIIYIDLWQLENSA